MDQVIYDNLKLDNLKGTVAVKDEAVNMQGLTFNTLGGQFATNGSYSSRDLQHPRFDFGLNIKNLNFQSAFAAFPSVKKLLPQTYKQGRLWYYPPGQLYAVPAL